jgi:hypothetical protein
MKQTNAIKRLVLSAIEAHGPLFNSEIRPSEIQERVAAETITAVYVALDTMAEELERYRRALQSIEANETTDDWGLKAVARKALENNP